MGNDVGQWVELVGELRSLAGEVQQDLDPRELELREIGMLVKQTAAEIERLIPQRNDAAKRIRDVEMNVERFSRSDIAQAYASSNEAQMRLFMMQRRLEQLEYKQQILERDRRSLLRFIGFIKQLPAAPTPTETAADLSQVATRESISLIVAAEEDERQRCAQAIHDGAAQGLSNLVLRAQLSQRLLDSKDPADEARAREEVAGLNEALSTALQEARRLIFELRPLVLEEVGLTAAIRKYVQALGDRTSMPLELRLAPLSRRFDDSVEIALFRLIQEAIANAVRHSRATLVQIAAGVADDLFRAVVEDDGVGFDAPASIVAARAARQLGLAVMLERVDLLGGRIAFDTAPGRGTRVAIEIPLPVSQPTEADSGNLDLVDDSLDSASPATEPTDDEGSRS